MTSCYFTLQAVINKEYNELAAIYYMLSDQHRANRLNLTANFRRHSSAVHMGGSPNQPVPQINIVTDNGAGNSSVGWNEPQLDPALLERYLPYHRHSLGPVQHQALLGLHPHMVPSVTTSLQPANQLAVRNTRRYQRRKSDGTASLIAYRNYQQQRGNPQLGPIAGSGVFGGVASGSSNALLTSEGGGAGSIKEGLEDLSNLQKYGRLSSTQRMYYNLHPTGGVASGARVFQPMEQTGVSLLQAQLKPFQDFTQNDLQKMLQDLNLQSKSQPQTVDMLSNQSAQLAAATPFVSEAAPSSNTVTMETVGLRHQPHSMGFLVATNSQLQAPQFYTPPQLTAQPQDVSYVMVPQPPNGQHYTLSYYSNPTPHRKPGTHISPELHANMVNTLRHNNVITNQLPSNSTHWQQQQVGVNHVNGDNVEGQQLELLLNSLKTAGISYQQCEAGVFSIQHRQAEVRLHLVQGAVQLVHVSGSAEQYQLVCSDLQQCLTSSA